MSAVPIPEALSTLWARHGLTASAIEARGDGTLVASDRTQLPESARTLLSDESGEGPALALSPEVLAPLALLGEGGMGEVHLARQGSLRREVAVKIARRDRPGATATLLKEAWVGGALEHPSVAPVHTLARLGTSPAVVMKRVEGTSWTRVIEDPGAHPRFRESPLEAHLDVLIRVAHAIGFAHERGVLHLDLKPDNVMIGAFGEVYVLDWGLAAGFGEAAPSWLVRADALRGLAGTPAYMPPELAAADAARVGPATDVYLLGGLLHGVLTGQPVHAGATVLETLGAAFRAAPPAYGDDVPAELATIARRALAADPADRFESAAAFRRALEEFLLHRRADRLARSAAAGLDALAAREEGAAELDPAPDAEVEPRFAEIELAIERARRSWEAHPALEALTDRLDEQRARHALAHERLGAARAFAARMRAAPAPLETALGALERRLEHRERHVRRLESMSRELDFSLGSAARRRLFAVLGAAWLLFSLGLGWLTRTGRYSIGYPELLVEGVLLVATFLPVGLAYRRTFFDNLANRRLYGGIIFTACAVELHWIACMLLGVSVELAVGITSLYYAYLFFTLAVVLDRRLWVASASMIGAFALVLAAPAYVFEWIGIGGACAMALTLLGWRERAAGDARADAA
ncbi:MAG: serine/threonine protein kinase [Sandaracinaceae bacterium]|nr:serine/threonine protein kinase [Sandaracinaceae bacterium]